jgi:hypothetical protein
MDVLDAVDVGGADTGADVGDVDDVTGTSADAGADDGTGGADDAAGGDGTGDGTEADAAEVDAAAGADGRKLPSALRNLVAQLKTTDPKLANQLKSQWFAEQAFKAEFAGGLKEARALKQFQEQVGGEEGWKQVQEALSASRQADELFAKGDISVIDNLATNQPEGFAKLVPAALDKLATVNPEMYQHVGARIVAASLPVDVMNAAYQALLAGEQTKPAAEALKRWFDSIQQLASKAPQKKIEPERRKLEQEKQEWQSAKTREFQKGIADEVTSSAAKQTTDLLKGLAGTRVLSEAATARLRANIERELDAQLLADKGFIEKRDRLLKEGDRVKILANFNQEVTKRLPEITKRVYREFYGTAAPVKAKTDVGQGTGGATGQAKQPSRDQIDWTRTTQRMILDNQAFVKGQTAKVTW